MKLINKSFRATASCLSNLRFQMLKLAFSSCYIQLCLFQRRFITAVRHLHGFRSEEEISVNFFLTLGELLIEKKRMN